MAGMSRRRGRTRTVLGEAHLAKVVREIVVGQPEVPTATIRGCMENAQACGLVLSIVAWGVKPDHSRSAWLDNADAVSSAGHSTAAAVIFSLWRVHSRPELAECRAIVQENLADIPEKQTHIRKVNRLPVSSITISISAGGIIMINQGWSA